jgi:hypothetical protein
MALMEFRFKEWLDDLERAAHHEAGHAIAMGDRAPGWLYRALLLPDPERPNAWGGATIPNCRVALPASDSLHVIAVSGCMAEAKFASNGSLNAAAMNSVADTIVQEVNAQHDAFQVDVPIIGREAEPEPASCTLDDFSLIAKPLNLVLVRAALVDASALLEDDEVWTRVTQAAGTLSAPPYVLSELP